MSPQIPRRGRTEEQADDFGDETSGRRAMLLESEAEELRQRLDSLLAEIGRHHRSRSAELAMLRRYAPAFIAIVAGATGIFALVRRRRRRQLAIWSRVGARAMARVTSVL